MIREIIRNFLYTNHIPSDSGFIIAVSGGADSIALLHACKYLNMKIMALHCNFNLRGKESDMDEQFVKRFCDNYGIALSVKKFDTTAYARQNGLSIEMAARDLRYGWFREMREKKEMDYIMIAHHADDVAETLFINLCRGTGIKGLTGIKAVNEEILRPLLSCSRVDILNYIDEQCLGYRTDSTNNSMDYVRNRVRHQIIPVLKEINPSFLCTTQENCQALKETEQIFNYGIKQLQEQIMDCENDEILINIAKTLESPAPYTLLYETLHPFGFNKTQIQDILNTQAAIPGKQFQAGNYMLTKGRTHWRLYDTLQHPSVRIEIAQEGNYMIGDKEYLFTIQPLPDDFIIPKDTAIACLDADKVKFPLLVRNWQAGDYFCPIGMKKSKKKISDFFADQKFSALQKQSCLLLLSGEEITWVINNRIDDRFKITSFTRNILQIKPV